MRQAFLLSFFLVPSAIAAPPYASEERGDSIHYAGIAYAKPPIGVLRWKRPLPEEGSRQLGKNVSCLQFGDDSFPDEGVTRQEDCLYLSVYSPKARSSKPLPVLVWIHGGALLSGTGLKKFYDGSIFAKNEIIFVSLNYRLGELGYGPKKTQESGSLGLLDQHTALLWVKKNIADFGGDPSRIFLMGHSKGAESIAALMESGLAFEGIQGGIALSGARHFDFGPGGKVPIEQHKFWPGEETLRGEEILSKVGYKVYNPELPSLRTKGEHTHRFSLLVSALYDEAFLAQPSNMYCGMRMAALQFFPYVEASLLVLHPFSYEHGDEVRSLFMQDKFGKKLLAYISDFVRGTVSPSPYKASGEVTHLYPWFTLSSSDLDPSYATHFNCEGEAYPGTSKVNWRFTLLENALRIFR